MNNLVQGLIDQALSEVVDGKGIVVNTFAERLNELLIKEVLNLLDDIEGPDSLFQDKDGIHISWKITEHFGVDI